MDNHSLSRRHFLFQLSAGAGAAWVQAHWPSILAAHEHARRVALGAVPAKFEFFSAAEASEIEAVAAQIIPTDQTPGAREAGAIHFIDRALVTFDKEKQPLYTAGLAELAAKLKELYPQAEKFSTAGSAEQIGVLTAIEKTDFFRAVREHTVMGFLCEPERGGNLDQVGWKTIGHEHAFTYEPPFGSYDRDYPGWQPAPEKGSK